MLGITLRGNQEEYGNERLKITTAEGDKIFIYTKVASKTRTTVLLQADKKIDIVRESNYDGSWSQGTNKSQRELVGEVLAGA